MGDATHDPLDWIDAALGELEQGGLLRRLAVRDGRQTATVVLDGRELVNFGSNDYLGLAADERLAAAARDAVERFGWGSGASPSVSGRSALHAELERRLAEFMGTEAALVFASGFAANVGTIAALVDQPDAIFCDAGNHASLIDGCRLAKAALYFYPHGDCDALADRLRRTKNARRRLIVSDTLFSMGGDVAPLVRLAELAEEYDAMLLVDEAHAIGVFGERGRGVVEEHGLEARVHIRVGTLSKTLGSAGGFVCGRRSLVDWLANRARSYVYSTAQPAAASAAAIAALDVVRDEPQRRSGLLQRAAALRTALREQGWPVRVGGYADQQSPASPSQIIPLVVGDADRTMRLAARLREAGYFVPGIRPPSVPEGQSLLRLSLCWHHTPECIDDFVHTLAQVR